MAKVKKNIRPIKKVFTSPFQIYWLKENYLFLISGIALLIVGFFLMSIGEWDNPISLTISPVILIISYFLIIPASIFFKKRKDKNNL